MELLSGEEHSFERHESRGRFARRASSQGFQKAELTREKYQKEVERYEGEKDAISDKAKDLEKERDLYRKRADHFDTAEVILEIGLIMCSLTLLANKKIFWFSGIAIAGIGVVVAAIAFLTRI